MPGYGKLRLRAPQDGAAGLFLVAIATFALWQSAELPAGTLNQMGPGMLPRALAVLTGGCGLALLVQAFRSSGGPALDRWSLRGPLCILGAVVAFALAVRPLGLVAAGPLAILIGGLASPETRWHEVAIFAVAITGFCLLLFKFLLGLPMPVAPWLIGY
jgi:putative tricarboxylic transport membrane protein